MDLDVRNDVGSRSGLFEVFLHLDIIGSIEMLSGRIVWIEIIVWWYFHQKVMHRLAGFQVKTADNRIIQDQLNQKVPHWSSHICKTGILSFRFERYWYSFFNFPFKQIAECEELKETVASLRQQLSDTAEPRNFIPLQGFSENGNLHMGFQIGRENSVPNDSNDKLVLQAQVPIFCFPFPTYGLHCYFYTLPSFGWHMI